MNEQELLALHQASTQHRDLLTTSKMCGCFRCLALFGFSEIRKWSHHDNTALCPRCSKDDAVIGDTSRPGLNRQTLEEMHHRWLETSRG